MVPFLPSIALGKMANKVNWFEFVLGDTRAPAETVRMETPEIITRRAPDGQLYYDIKLKFLFRKLRDECYAPAGGGGFGTYVTTDIGWNWAYGVPSVRQDLLHRRPARILPIGLLSRLLEWRAVSILRDESPALLA